MAALNLIAHLNARLNSREYSEKSAREIGKDWISDGIMKCLGQKFGAQAAQASGDQALSFK